MNNAAHTEQSTGDYGVILFDGVCNFCNSSVNFVIERDKANYFKFASLQSDTGQLLLKKHSLDGGDIDSVVLIEDGAAYVKSTAALRVARRLGGIYSLAYVFIVLPKFIRDIFYDLIARNRYRLFGKKDSCAMPTPELRRKFL